MSRVHDGPEPSDSPELARYLEETETSANQWMHRWTLIMKAHKIDEVHVIYGAGEDDGGIEEVEFFRRVRGKLAPVEKPPLPSKTYPYGVTCEFESFMYDLMQARGFFNQNEGCQGIIRWSIDKDMLIHDHQTNEYGETERTGEEGQDGEDERETTYIPQPVETYYGVDDIERRLEP